MSIPQSQLHLNNATLVINRRSDTPTTRFRYLLWSTLTLIDLNLTATGWLIVFLNGPFPASFSLFSSFQYSWQ